MSAKFHVLSIDGPVMRLREHRKPRQHTKDKHGCILCRKKHVKVRCVCVCVTRSYF